MRNAYFGSTLLTAYFNFKTPTGDELNAQKVIATSDKFALNSQVAMMFYDDDATVRSTYQRFYMLGTDSIDWEPMAKRGEEVSKTITGGAEQKKRLPLHRTPRGLCSTRLLQHETRATGREQKARRHRLPLSCRRRKRTFEFEDFDRTAAAGDFAR